MNTSSHTASAMHTSARVRLPRRAPGRMLRSAVFIALAAVYAGSALHAQGRSKFADCLKVEGAAAHDFGAVGQSETVEHVFVLRNSCSSTVNIESAKTSCGCTAAVISEKVVAPGGTAKISVRYTPTHGTVGEITKGISVYLQGETAPVLDLQISAKIRTDIVADPVRVNVPDTPVGTPVKVKTVIRNDAATPANVHTEVNTMSIFMNTTENGGSSAKSINRDKILIEPADFTLKPHERREVSITAVPESTGKLYGAVEFIGPTSQVFFTFSGTITEKGAAKPDQPASQQPASKPTSPKKRGRK